MSNPVSTKLLRPISRHDCVDNLLVCHKCGKETSAGEVPTGHWYKDFAAAPGELSVTCGSCSLLEDMDPDWPENQGMLFSTPVRRKMPFQEVEDLGMFFTGLDVAAKAGQTPGGKLWVALPHNSGFPLYSHVKPTQKLIDFIAEKMIYGYPYECPGDFYYVQINWMEGTDEALVSLKYQRILGYRALCRVPRQLVHDFFDPKEAP